MQKAKALKRRWFRQWLESIHKGILFTQIVVLRLFTVYYCSKIRKDINLQNPLDPFVSISILFSLVSMDASSRYNASILGHSMRSKRAAIAADLGISKAQPTRDARNTLRPFWWRPPHMDSKGILRAYLCQKTPAMNPVQRLVDH
jgi:hypothetical protein